MTNLVSNKLARGEAAGNPFRGAMWYYPGNYLLGARDVIATWLVCIAVSACAMASHMVPLVWNWD